MGVRLKALVAAGVVVIAIGGVPHAAHAATFEDQKRRDFSFTRNGQPVTCTVAARNTYSIVDRAQFFNASTSMVDLDSACRAAVMFTSVTITWLRRDDGSTGGRIVAEADRGFVLGGADYPEDTPLAGSVRGSHVVGFECDEPRPGTDLCFFQFFTSPK